ncbi:MAG: flippase [Candidatus Magasanikbacteria bacterium]|nr:flippase [Candidatus Magasanikbacteria bacterium]
MGFSVTRNTALMTAASIGQKVIALGYFTFLARSLNNPEDLGAYMAALSIVAIVVIFIDLGLGNVLVREAAKSKEKIQAYLSSVLGLKVLLAGVVLTGFVLGVFIFPYRPLLRQFLLVGGVNMLLETVSLTLYGVLRAFGDLRYEAVGIIGNQFGVAIFGSAVLFWRWPLVFLMAAFTFASACQVALAVVVLYRRYGVVVRPRWSKPWPLFFVKMAIPFALAAVFFRVYSYIDTVIILHLAGERAVGWYSIPVKITNAFLFIPLSLGAALYPRMSEYWVTNRAKLGDIFAESVIYLTLLILPVVVGLRVVGRDLVPRLFTSHYLASIPALGLLLFSMFFSFLTYPTGALLNASGRQSWHTAVIGAVMVINIALNFFSIPRYGVVGAALAALIGNIIFVTAEWLLINRLISIPYRRVFAVGGKALLSAVVMGAVVWWLRSQAPLGVAMAIGAVLYPLLLYLFRAVTMDQIKQRFYQLQN